jgi:hypothetical protein
MVFDVDKNKDNQCVFLYIFFICFFLFFVFYIFNGIFMVVPLRKLI